MDLKKKIGPLPVWAWGVILGVAGYFLYERYASSSSSSSSPGTTGILDPNAVDPNTGLTYGQEEASALNDQAALSGSGGASVPSDSGAQSTVAPTDEFGDFLNFIGEWNQFAQALGWTAPGTVSSNTTAAAAASPAVQTTSPPTSSASAHTSTTIDTHPGGPFYVWYTRVFGTPPPAHVPSNGAAYTLWKQGISVASAKTLVAGNKVTAAAAPTITAAGKAIQPTKPKPAKPPPKPKKGVGSAGAAILER